MNKFKIEMMKLLRKSGRKKGWLSDVMGIQRCKFWRMANADSFSPEQKQEIRKLLSNQTS